MLNLLNRLLKTEIVILALLASSIAIYAAAEATDASQDSYATFERL